MLMDILAGIVCGLVMGSVFLGAGISIIYTTPDIYDQLVKKLPRNLPPTLVMLGLLIGVPPLWGVFGAIAGLLYNLALDSFPGGGLGSSDFAFTLGILSLTVLAMLAALVLILTRKKAGWLCLIVTLAFAGIFGWLLPLLANWR